VLGAGHEERLVLIASRRCPPSRHAVPGRDREPARGYLRSRAPHRQRANVSVTSASEPSGCLRTPSASRDPVP